MALLFELKQKLSQGFSALWTRYPNKSAKQDAAKAYSQIVKTPDIDAKVHGALDWQIPHWESLDWYHPPYLATYLRKRRWEDEQPTTTPNRPIVTPPKTLVPMALQQQDASARIRSLIATGMDPEEAKQQVYRAMGWVKE